MEWSVRQAAEFNGESGIRLPDQLIDHDDYSIALWIYPHAFTEHTPALFAALNEDQWISIVPSSHLGGPMVWYGNDEWYDALLNHPIRRNQWTHLAVTVESREIKIYHNGVLSFEGSRFSRTTWRKLWLLCFRC